MPEISDQLLRVAVAKSFSEIKADLPANVSEKAYVEAVVVALQQGRMSVQIGNLLVELASLSGVRPGDSFPALLVKQDGDLSLVTKMPRFANLNGLPLKVIGEVAAFKENTDAPTVIFRSPVEGKDMSSVLRGVNWGNFEIQSIDGQGKMQLVSGSAEFKGFSDDLLLAPGTKGRIELQSIDKQEVVFKLSPGVTDDAIVHDIAQKTGLKADAVLKEVISSLIAKSVPLNVETIAGMVEALRPLLGAAGDVGNGMEVRHLAAAMATMKKADLPIDAAFIKDLSELLKNPMLLGQRLSELGMEVAKNASALFFAGNIDKNIASLQEFFLLHGGTITPKASKEGAMEIESFVKDFFMSGENKNSADNAAILKQLLLKLPQTEAMSLQRITPDEEKIRELLPLATSLIGAGHAQMAGVDENGVNFLNFSLPLASREQGMPNSIRIEYKDENGTNKIDWQNCKIILKMKTRNLSELQIDLEFRKGVLSCQVGAIEEYGMRRIAATKDELRDSLESAGFNVGMILTRLLRKLPEVNELPLNNRSFGFDFKV
jgi:hypothetical protein